MTRTLRLFAAFASGVALLSFGVLVVNQTAQLVQLAGTVHPTFGRVTLWVLVATYGGLIGVPVVLFVRLPRPLVPPETDEGPEFDAHLERLRQRLARNPLVANRPLTSRADIESALRVLEVRADEVVKQAASHVFLATAVSQSGRLDALMVLMAQSVMVYRVAQVYSQRPGAREMLSLYANVAGTAFVAGELGDVDLSDQVEPVLAAAIGALGASIPGLQVAGAVLTNCVLSGSANAFLTLRVGMITRQHAGALVARPKLQIRRSATVDAARLLRGIVSEGTRRLTGAVLQASKERVNQVVSTVSESVSSGGRRLVQGVKTRFRGARLGDEPLA